MLSCLKSSNAVMTSMLSWVWFIPSRLMYYFGVTDDSTDSSDIESDSTAQLQYAYRTAPLPVDERVGIFGVRLSVLIARDGTSVPRFVRECVAQIEQRGMIYEGIFRIPGSEKHMKTILTKLASGEECDLQSFDVHTVASLLKKFLRELPNPIIDDNNYDIYLRLADSKTEEDKIATCRSLLLSMSTEVKDLLLCILQLLHKTSHEYLEKTRMTTSNLSFIWGMNLIRCDDAQLMRDIAKINCAMKVLIDVYPQIADLAQTPPL